MQRMIFLPALLMTFVTVVSSCSKDDDPPVPEPDRETGPLLKKIEYQTFGTNATYEYNADSTLKKIVFVSAGGTSTSLDLTHEDKKIKETMLASSIFRTKYTYAAGRIDFVEQTEIGSLNRGRRFEYSYNPDGTVSRMKYFSVNEAGSNLIYDNTYEYDAAKQLKKIRSASATSVLTLDIETYSGECYFNPWTFISPNLSELYEVYNYPVLSKLRKLPKKMIRTVAAAGAAPRVEKIFDTDFTLTGKRLDKTITSVVYPDDPSLTTSSTAVFKYE